MDTANLVKVIERLESLPSLTQKQMGLLGFSYLNLKKLDKALGIYEALVSATKVSVDDLLNAAVCFRLCNQPDKAHASLLRAKSRDRKRPEPHFLIGQLAIEKSNFTDAIEHLHCALALGLDTFELYYGIAKCCLFVNKPREALKFADLAYRKDKTSQKLYKLLTDIFIYIKDYKNAHTALRKLTPITEREQLEKHSTDLVLLGHLCIWDEAYQQQKKLILGRVIEGTSVGIQPLELCNLFDDPCIFRHYFGVKFKSAVSTRKKSSNRPRYSSEPIKIAYISADFRSHAVGYLIEGLLKHHDLDKFQVHLVSIGISEDSQTDILKGYSTSFSAVSPIHPQSLLNIINRLSPHICIDLMGHTFLGKPDLFGKFTDSVNISYLGYPGTTGTPGFDYIIGDSVVIPDGDEIHYSEQVLRLPGCYQVNNYRLLDPVGRKADWDLPDSFVFCCFNFHQKISPDSADAWVTILDSCADSVLWLLDGAGREALIGYMKARGIDEKRVLFAPLVPREEHLRRISVADLFLDTWPYNAHVTGADALSGGVPVLTKIGRSFQARVCASMLLDLNQKMLVADSVDDYIQKAIHFYSNPNDLKRIRETILKERRNSYLFNSQRKTKDIEAIYTSLVD